jgi:hypothetical protein
MVAEGMLSNDAFLTSAGLASYFLEASDLPADLQSQLQTIFIQDALADLALLNANGSP